MLYVPIRSDCIRILSPLLLERVFTKSVPFLYVLGNPSLEMQRCHTSLHVLLRSHMHFGRSHFAAKLLPPSFALPIIGRHVLKRHLLLRSYTFLIRSYTFRGAPSLWDLLASTAPGLDSAFWGTSHETWPRLNQIVDFR